MRVLTICNSTKENEVTHLAKKCRTVGEKWIDLMTESARKISSTAIDEVEKLRIKMINVGVSCVLTFSTHEDRIGCLLSSSADVISLLKAATTIHDNIILNKNQSNIGTFTKSLIRLSERGLVMVQPTIAKFLRKTSCKSLNEFVVVYWAVMKKKGSMKGHWKKRTKYLFDGWYDCRYESKYISIDCIRGTFLVDNMTIGILPEKMIYHELFVRTFGQHIFEVQAAETANTYITKHRYHGNGRVLYEFHLNDRTNHLTITERHIETHDIFQLIPHQCFKNELPDMFLSNHSHWWNLKDQIIEFRSVHFKDVGFLTNKPYILSLETGFITTNETEKTQMLVNQSSPFFEHLFLRYFSRLDNKPYVYMMRDNVPQSDTTIHIHLSRLGIAFQYSIKTRRITSREYSDMCIDGEQWLGTLTGLTSGLLLSPLLVNNHKLDHYPYRKLIVPFGEIHSTEHPDGQHQIVTVERTTLSKEFRSHYFVFILNDRLRTLQSSDSPTGWLYLALLHAMTTHSLPDEYIGMTGAERAFQLLNSAGCWSDQPFDSLCLNILTQIATISPRSNYYPEHLARMQTIEWNSNGLPYSLQHFGYYLIAKNLINAAQELNFMYSSSMSTEMPKLFEGKLYNEMLLKKLYWDYRDSYNPTVRLSVQMEANISRSTSSAQPYHSTSEYYSHLTNSPAVRLVDGLYCKGNINLKDCSNLHWLPLSQWLTDENQLKNIWIGLLIRIDRSKKQAVGGDTDEVRRLTKLLDFLCYISRKCNTKLFYLKMLKTALIVPTISLHSIVFPDVIGYENIEESSVVKERIHLITKNHTKNIRNQLLAEIERCWIKNCDYEDVNHLITPSQITQINILLRSWRSNQNLQSFLKVVQNLICSFPIATLNINVPHNAQQFALESLVEHHSIQLKSLDKSIDEKLLSKAEHKFHRPHSNLLGQRKVSCQASNQKSEFPDQIFHSVNNKDDPLGKINDYFKDYLAESWGKLLPNEQCGVEYPSVEETNERLYSMREESIQYWNELVKSITSSSELLFDSGVVTRITPTTLISILQQRTLHSESSWPLNLTEYQCTLLGATIVNWTLEQQMERALHFARHKKYEDYEKELSNIPHSNWTPSERVAWLILELEMNIIIRAIQVKVAHHMMRLNSTADDSRIKSIVMQMNMGEGKTSVILPMLAVNLSSNNSSFVRIVVLKSLFPTNYQSLRYKLGGLLNRRIFPFACRRDMSLSNENINKISNRLTEGLRNCDVILASPEDILSFDLLTIDKCRRAEFDVGRSMLTIQRWLKAYVRDVLDESDEVLHVKYQLIYTVGGQEQVDGGVERWKTIQSILDLVKKHAADIFWRFSEEVCYKPSEQKSAFPQFRLQSHHPYATLCESIANDWIKNRNYRQNDERIILSFILKVNSSVEHIVDKFSSHDIQLFLIVRGLLSSEVLLMALKKRYRVNYGISVNPSFNRLMAVPFRAKDVAADRTEFGHPDVALVLTQLSYYYCGLNDSQLIECFDRLSDKESDPATVYEQWIQYEEQDAIHASIRQWKEINLKDHQQRTQYIYPIFRHNMLVVNYFLNHFVFLREAKQFPHKIVSSAWDLSSSLRTKIITGFSGTNDTQLLLPIDIHQDDLLELRKTDATVVNNLLQAANESYQSLPMNATSDDILNQISRYETSINVILDVGALFTDGTNQDIAVKWLNLSNKDKIDYVVYFESDSIVVCDRQFHHHRFETSPASERVDHCVFYLDDIHTRGTDFKFPTGFRAAVTLGNGLTKDRFVQACMRMRKLGEGHSLTFWSSVEVHQQITTLKQQLSTKIIERTIKNQISVVDIFRWVYQNTGNSTWEGLHQWAEQSLSFQRKIHAFRTIDWKDHQQQFTDSIMGRLATECLEPETIELKHMYGAPKELRTIHQIYSDRYKRSEHYSSTEIRGAVLKRLTDYGGSKQCLSQLLDEEQQRELEHELESERQLTRPLSAIPYSPTLHKDIKRLCDKHENELKLDQLPKVFRPLPYAFVSTTFLNSCEPDSWQKNVWVSTEFQRVVEITGESLNSFLRPPRWIVVYRNKHIIFVSAFEANWLIGKLQSNELSTTTLRLLLPRTKRAQAILVNTPTLTIPPSVKPPSGTVAYSIPLECLVQLFVFNGTLYFESGEEQRAYCQCLSLCPKPRTKKEEEAFEKGWIAADGFVNNPEHCLHLQINQARFTSNPLSFVKALIENRNNFPAPPTSHVGSVLVNARQLI